MPTAITFQDAHAHWEARGSRRSYLPGAAGVSSLGCEHHVQRTLLRRYLDAVEAVHAVLREYNESLTYGNDLDSMVVLKTKLAFKKEVLQMRAIAIRSTDGNTAARSLTA